MKLLMIEHELLDALLQLGRRRHVHLLAKGEALS
jgi:hypothetical protein